MNDNERIECLREKIAAFPKQPGVYLMKDRQGVVLYIGKAKDLRRSNRGRRAWWFHREKFSRVHSPHCLLTQSRNDAKVRRESSYENQDFNWKTTDQL